MHRGIHLISTFDINLIKVSLINFYEVNINTFIFVCFVETELEAYLRCNRRLEELTHNQNEKLRKKIMTDQTFQDPRTLENFYNQNKSERKTVIETVRSDYIQTNKKLRRRIKKLDKFDFKYYFCCF